MKKIFYIVLLAIAAMGCKSSEKAATAGESEAATNIVAQGQYITPDQFGAKGDGKTDDTDALREALFMSNRTGKILYIPSERNYRVKGTLNYYEGRYQSYRLNMLGTLPLKQESYSPGVSGGISVDNGVSLFKSATIKGSIERVCITGKRDLSVHMFDNCTCSNLVIHGCNISNFGAIFYDSPVNHVSEITYNSFLTAYYFARNDKTSSEFTDSFIIGNYINGGTEQNDNVCFEWSSFNGANVVNNFIDYYRTVYQPKAAAKLAFVGPNSSNNQYQVFRYLYAAGQNINTITFYSNGDAFNWVDPTTLEKLQKFVPLQYKGKDGKMYDYPPYIAICNSAWRTNIIGAKLERKIKEVVFINSGLTEYEHNVFDVEFTGITETTAGAIAYRKGDAKPFYNNGKFMQNQMRIRGLAETLTALPTAQIGWTKYPAGSVVIVGGKRMQAKNVMKAGKWSVEWVEAE